MDSQSGTSNQKREHDQDNSEQNKRKKPEVLEEIDATTNFTDVNDDCLVHIFKLLKLRDLFNVADTCKRFQASAQSTFTEKYRRLEIHLKPNSIRMQPIELIENTVMIFDLTSCLKVLRHFGVKIFKLNIRYSYQIYGDQRDALAWYMNEYCADSLVDLKIERAPTGMTNNWTKPFSNVESLKLLWFDLVDLNAKFPNVRRLLIDESRQWIESTLPQLEELKITIYNNDDRASLAKILLLNQHLQILRLSGYDCDMKYLKSICKYLQSIKFLDIDGFFDTEGGSVHLKNVNEFHIKLPCFSSSPKIPFTFDQLRKVELTVDELNFNNKFQHFIRANPSLKEMKIYIEKSMDSQDTHSVEQIKADIAKLWPSLEVHVTVTEDDIADEGEEEGEGEEEEEDWDEEYDEDDEEDEMFLSSFDPSFF